MEAENPNAPSILSDRLQTETSPSPWGHFPGRTRGQARCALKPHLVGRDAGGRGGWDNIYSHKRCCVNFLLKKKNIPNELPRGLLEGTSCLLPNCCHDHQLTAYLNQSTEKQQAHPSPAWRSREPLFPGSGVAWQLFPRLSPAADREPKQQQHQEMPSMHTTAAPCFSGARTASDLGCSLKKGTTKLRPQRESAE